MKNLILKTIAAFLTFVSLNISAQVQMDKAIELTGSDGNRMLTNLESPVNGTDAVNKSYVDAAVAASGGSSATMISNESATAMNYGDALRYCKALTEGGYSDWYIPELEEFHKVLSKGGITVSNPTSSNAVWFSNWMPIGSLTSFWSSMRLSDGSHGSHNPGSTTTNYVRCVR